MTVSVRRRSISRSISSMVRSCCSQTAVRFPRASSIIPTLSFVSGSSWIRVWEMVSCEIPDWISLTRESMFIPGDWMVWPGRVMILGISLIIVVSVTILSVITCGERQEARRAIRMANKSSGFILFQI